MTETNVTEEKIYEVPLRDIRVSDENIRKHDEKKGLEELMASIEKHGLLQPVVLRGEYGGPRPYQLVVGQRRFLAHERLKRVAILARFAGPLDKWQAAIRSLAENMHRVEVNHADAMDAVTKLYNHFERNLQRVKKETGMSLQRIRQYIYIQERVSDATRESLKKRKVAPADVERALRAAGGVAEKADKLLRIMEEEGYTRYEKERMVRFGEANPNAKPEEIAKEAGRPVVEASVLVPLPLSVRRGLQTAAKILSMEEPDVAARAIYEWLSSKGFIQKLLF